MARRHEQEIALDELISYVEPKSPEVSFRVLLCKSPTQEEFIRGNMGRRPYSNKDAGPLMRDVKNMICQRLELHGLLEDDFGMELLVCNKIVSLNLPLDKVYEQVCSRAPRGTLLYTYMRLFSEYACVIKLIRVIKAFCVA